MDEAFLETIVKKHQACDKCPKSEDIAGFFNSLLGLLFPNFANEPIQNVEELNIKFEELKNKLWLLISDQDGLDKGNVVAGFFEYIPELYEQLTRDVEATYEGDPAANNTEEVVRSYPGFYTIAAYRVGHKLLGLKVDKIPRSITEHAHSKTGIDIHPGARIGEYFCIDHGTGVVIGETAIIGNHVKIYQGVTLGALSINKRSANVKRHPTIGDHVVIYAGATILGGKTEVGAHSVIGGNVWLTESVPDNSKVYYQASMHTEGKESSPDLIIVKQSE